MIGYIYTDCTFPLVPGNRASTPLGWWAWDDQREYLRGAKAFLRGDLDPSQHLYPPLYPLIGALFLRAAPQAPFFWPDLVFMLAYFVLFVSLFGRYVGTVPAVVCGLIGMLSYFDFRAQWLMPWTTTPAAVCILSALFLLDRAWRERYDLGLRARVLNAGGFGLAVGLLAAARPVDTATSAPLWLTYAWLVAASAFRRSWREALAEAGAGVAGVAIALIPYLLFNLASYGTLLGRYVALNAKMGFDPSALPLAFYSHWLSSAPLFAEAHADWASRVPLALLAVAFLPPSLAWGPMIFRLAAACGLVQFAVYYSDHDILPTGTFRFCNIHYFKWLAPVAFVLAYHALRAATSYVPALRRRGALSLGFVVAAALFGASLEAVADAAPAPLTNQTERELTFALPAGPLDYVDVSGVGGAWGALYFPSGAEVRLDDNAPLAPVRDWRFLPTASGFRIFFPTKATAKTLTILLADGMAPMPGASIHATAARLTWAFTFNLR